MAKSFNRRGFIHTLGAGMAVSQVLPFHTAGATFYPSNSANNVFYGPDLPDKEKFFPIDLRNIRMEGEAGRRINATVYNNVLKVDMDGEFLSSFRDKGNPEAGFVGIGMMLDAVVKFAAYTGDEKVISLKDHIVDTLIANQEPDGYIGNMKPESRMVKLWDIHETGYIIYGLISDYRLFGLNRPEKTMGDTATRYNRVAEGEPQRPFNRPAAGSVRSETVLNAAKRAADYILERWHMIGDDWGKETHVATHVAITGIHRTMLALHDVTGERKYLDFCLEKHDLRKLNPGIVIGRKDLIEGHIYGYMAASLAQLELYQKIKDPSLTVPAIAAINFLTASDGMAITGGAGQVEIWSDDQDGRGDLGETCATAYQLRVYDQLLRLTGDSRFGDIMERTICNALFGAQSPDGRKIRYFTPTEGPRVYHHNDSYCCPNNYRRIVADLPFMVVYAAPDAVVVNQYIQSEASVITSKTRVKIIQKTSYPNTGKINIRIDPEVAAQFDLMLRIPLWCKSAEVRVNGETVNENIAGGTFLPIKRTWNPGDQVDLVLSMEWRLVKGRKRQAGRVAVMRGPQLYCLNPSQNEQIKDMDGIDLGKLVIDLPAIEPDVASDSAVRPEGTACHLKAGKSQWGMGNTRDLPLNLTEFPDPEGKCTYFKTPEINDAVEDELHMRLFLNLDNKKSSEP